MPSPIAPDLASHWTLDPNVTYLNHGSFGACPRVVLEAQSEWRARLERQPFDFLMRQLPALITTVREVLAEFADADPAGLVLVRNATEGVNAVLGSRRFDPGDEILMLDHAYGACRQAAEAVAARTGAVVRIAVVPFPGATPARARDAVLEAVTPRTRLAIIDHVTSPTAMVMPVGQLVPALESRGIDVLVDGAHALGMLDLSIRALAPAYYTANCHKWTCAPKGAACLWVRGDRRADLLPLVVSHGHGLSDGAYGRNRLQLEFDWPGTFDPTAWLSIPTALEANGRMLPGGWPAVRAHSRALALRGRDTVLAAVGGDAPCSDDMIGTMATVALPDAPEAPCVDAFTRDPLQLALVTRHKIEVPILSWPAPPRRWVRLSAWLYNHEDQYATLAKTLVGDISCESDRGV